MVNRVGNRVVNRVVIVAALATSKLWVGCKWHTARLGMAQDNVFVWSELVTSHAWLVWIALSKLIA